MAIGRFQVSIGGTTIKRVRYCEVEKFTRSETRTTSFAGTDRVDRSAIKYRVKLTIPICSESEMQALVGFASTIVQSVTFPDGALTVTKDMIIDFPHVPSAIYKFGDKTQGISYKDLVINMEEP